MNRIAIFLAVVSLLGGCKKKPSGPGFPEALKKMSELTAMMCTCKDKACADGVQERMTKWASDAAKNEGWSKEKPDEATIKTMTETGEKYAACMTQAMGGSPPADAAAPAPSTIKLSTPSDRPPIAKLIQEAKEHTGVDKDELILHILTARYVTASGELDPKYGELTLGFGNRLPQTDDSDDPDRPTGAPEPEPVASKPPKRSDTDLCPLANWSSSSGWTWSVRSCLATSGLTPRCSTAEVWKRALLTKEGVQPNAVAVLDLVRNEDASQSWEFTIRDARRKVDVRIRIPDTCDPIAEKP